jgi:hypothetical protein
MTSITMSANSSEVDPAPGVGAGSGVGSALAVPIANTDSPIIAPANTQRIATPFTLLRSSIPREASTGPHPPHAQPD